MVQENNERRSKISPATSQRHAQLRAILLAAAAQTIETHGLGKLRARDLAETAGCSIGAIYNVFKDLDELILAVNAETLGQISRVMQAMPDAEPVQQLISLANAYIDFARANRLRWDALFIFRIPGDPVAPDWFLAVQDAAFSHLERPLGRLLPSMPPAERRLLGRSLFAAVHGMVALGLERRVAQLDLPALRAQVALILNAMAAGLAGPAEPNQTPAQFS